MTHDHPENESAMAGRVNPETQDPEATEASDPETEDSSDGQDSAPDSADSGDAAQ